MLLYHIRYTNKPMVSSLHTLHPQIPIKTLKTEDNTIPRLCFSSSIENCLKSISEWFYEKYPYDEVYFNVFTLDTENYKGKIIYPSDLYLKNLVPDALECQEFWIMEIIKLKNKCYHYYINEDYDYEIEQDMIEEKEKHPDRIRINEFVLDPI